MIFAMVFTISCSGDRGPRGVDGKNCSVSKLADGSGARITCPGDVDGVIIYNGGEGPDGQLPAGLCRIAQGGAPSAAYTIQCGDQIIPIYGAPGSSGGGGGGGGSSGGSKVDNFDQYNPYELGIVLGAGDTLWLCNGNVYNKDENICTNGEKRTVDINKDYYNVGEIDILGGTSGSSGTSAGSNSGLVGDGNAAQTITNGLVLSKSKFICNEADGNVDHSTLNTLYNPNVYFCYADGSSYKLAPLCGSNDYLASSKFCFESKTGFKAVVNLCGGTNGKFTYSQFCQTTSTNDYGDGTYSSASSKVANLCGNNDWTGKIFTFKGGARDGEISNYNAGVYYDRYKAYDYGDYAQNATYFTAPTLGPVVGGKQVCDADGVVRTQCGIPTSGTGTSAVWTDNEIKKADLRSQFCRRDPKWVNSTAAAPYTQRVEVVDNCRNPNPKPSDYPNGKGGLYFDGLDYFCQTTTGFVRKMCAGTFYDDVSQFCYKEGSTAIAVGDKCRINPMNFPTSGITSANYRDAQYDPRKQFCTIKIASLPASNLNNDLPPGAALQVLNGQVQGGVNVGSRWVNSTSSIVLQTNYTTNTFPNVWLAPTTTNANVQQGGTVGYTYEEVPEDMCQTSIKYNQNTWLWQSCLVTNVQDRTKDRYLHCGVGERPKEDFSGCEKIPDEVVVSCYGGEVAGWTGLVCGATTVCTSIAGGKAESGRCVCEAGYVINSKASPTACLSTANGTVPNGIATCAYVDGTGADYVGIPAANSATGNPACILKSACIAANVAAAAPPAGACTPASSGARWFATNNGLVNTGVRFVAAPTGNLVYTSTTNADYVYDNEDNAFGAITTDNGTEDYCKVAPAASSLFCGTVASGPATETCTVTTVASATGCDP